jgi:hypothetical protein
MTALRSVEAAPLGCTAEGEDRPHRLHAWRSDHRPPRARGNVSGCSTVALARSRAASVFQRVAISVISFRCRCSVILGPMPGITRPLRMIYATARTSHLGRDKCRVRPASLKFQRLFFHVPRACLDNSRATDCFMTSTSPLVARVGKRSHSNALACELRRLREAGVEATFATSH